MYVYVCMYVCVCLCLYGENAYPSERLLPPQHRLNTVGAMTVCVCVCVCVCEKEWV